MPLFFCNQKKSRKTVKEKFCPLLYSLALRTSAVKALVCPFAARRSRFGLRYSRVRGRRQSKFPAASATGGARNFYPGGFFNTPCAPDRQRRLRAGQGYYFNAAARGARSLRRQSRDWCCAPKGACTFDPEKNFHQLYLYPYRRNTYDKRL